MNAEKNLFSDSYISMLSPRGLRLTHSHFTKYKNSSFLFHIPFLLLLLFVFSIFFYSSLLPLFKIVCLFSYSPKFFLFYFTSLIVLSFCVYIFFVTQSFSLLHLWTPIHLVVFCVILFEKKKFSLCSFIFTYNFFLLIPRKIISVFFLFFIFFFCGKMG